MFDFNTVPGIAHRGPAATLAEGMRAAMQHVQPDPARYTTMQTRPTLYAASGAPISFEAYCRMRSPSFQWDGPHFRALDAELDLITQGKNDRLIISMPPRHGKSEKVTVRYAAYRLELNPSTRIIMTSWGQALAEKFSRKTRRIVEPNIEFSRDRKAVSDWETVEGGGVRAAGIRAGVTGYGANLMLIDDPIKDRRQANSITIRDDIWESYLDDLTTRLEPGAAMIVTMTRWHHDDLVGRILKSEEKADWRVLNLPAIAEADDPLGRPIGAALWPERWNEKYFARRRKISGTRGFNSLYQGRPSAEEGNIFNRKWFRFYTTPDHPIIENGHAVPFLPPVMESWLQSWDMSFKDNDDNDKVSGLVASRLGADIYLRDRSNDRRDFVATIKEVERLAAKWPDAVLKLVEDKANGPAVISMLRSKVPGLVAVNPDGDKTARAYAVTPYCEAGNVWLPHPGIAPWVDEFLQQLLDFPHGIEDDDVDAFTQMLNGVMKQLNWYEDDLYGTGSGQPSETARLVGLKY